MFRAEVKINKKDYMSLSRYYLRKFIGLREIILVVLLLVAGILIGAMSESYFVLILCFITVAVMLIAVAIYLFTSRAGYKAEFEKRGAVRWMLTFSDVGFVADVFEKGGEEKYTDKRLYTDIDRVALKKDRAYIYASSAMMYYIKYDDFTEGDFGNFCEFLKETLEPSKFKMKAKFRRFAEQKPPKKKEDDHV